MFRNKAISFVAGFFILFFMYHFPEFFQAFWIMAVFKIGFLIIAYFLAVAQGWKGLEGYGLYFHTRWGKNLLFGLLLGIIFFSLSFFLSIQLGYEKIAGIDPLPTIINQLPLILLMTAVPSLAEDILTRGYFYGHLIKYLKPINWMLLSSFIYVLNHIWRLDEGAAVLTYLFILGLVLAYAVLMTRSLWLAFGIHWGANIAFEIINSFFQSTPLKTDYSTTCILAAIWAFLLAILMLSRKMRNIEVFKF